MRRIACTSFSPSGYELYGKRFLLTFLRHWRIPITVFYEGIRPEIEDHRIEYVDLLDDPDLYEFLTDHGEVDSPNYRFKATKFARKVFALTRPRECDWWIWLDADIVTFADVSEGYLEKLCPESVTASYLGRTDWDHSECGFVAYNLNNGGHEFLRRFREFYTSGEIFELSQWHDSYVFDRVREEFEMGLYGDYQFCNLSHDSKGLNVFEQTILGKKMKHLKGNLKHAS